MGLILDTSVLVQAERSVALVREVAAELAAKYSDPVLAISVITVAEFTHGIYRAPSPARALKRRNFLDQITSQLMVHDLTVEIASLTGRIEGEQAAKGIAIAFQDLVIGATALHLDYSVLTSNTRHFSLIPNLTILPI